jgi:mycoredoxin
VEDDVDGLVMYSTPWCGYCQRLKSQLGRAGIEFTEVNIEADPEAEAFVVSVNEGNATVPTLRLPDGRTMTNPTFADLQAALAG